MDIINKIKSLYKDKLGDGAHIQYNQAIDDVVIILKAEFEPKDQPDSQGYWMFYPEDEEEPYMVIVTSGLRGLSAIGFFEDTWSDVKNMKGKWVKAIIP